MDSTLYFWNLFFIFDDFQKGFALFKVARAEVNEHKNGSKCVRVMRKPPNLTEIFTTVCHIQ